MGEYTYAIIVIDASMDKSPCLQLGACWQASLVRQATAGAGPEGCSDPSPPTLDQYQNSPQGQGIPGFEWHILMEFCDKGECRGEGWGCVCT